MASGLANLNSYLRTSIVAALATLVESNDPTNANDAKAKMVANNVFISPPYSLRKSPCLIATERQ
jgi:hypothetical protein